MRDIDDLLKQKPKPAKMTPEEVLRLVREDDARMVNTFGRPSAPRKQDIRPWK